MPRRSRRLPPRRDPYLSAEYRRATPRRRSPDVSPIDPERLYQASRAGTFRRLIGEGEPPDRAERLVAQWELQAAKDDLERDGRYWDARLGLELPSNPAMPPVARRGATGT
jgi:hypothetical protein